MKKLIFLVLILCSINAIACDCAILSLIDRYESADFVATAKIEKITPEGSDYHSIEIKIDEVFKGQKVVKLRIESILNSSCAFYTPKGSKWLIFAYEDNEKGLVFGSCSGAVRLDRMVKEEKYPGLAKKIELSNLRKLNVLRYIKESELDIKNDFRLNYTILDDCLDMGKGFNLEEGVFSLFKIKISKKLKVKKVTKIKGFQNEKLNGIVIKCFKESFDLYHADQSQITTSSEITVAIYFYGAEGEHQSFVAAHDL